MYLLIENFRMQKFNIRKVDWVLIAVLTAVPVVRELCFGVFDHHHQPFATSSALIHTGLEMFFMALVGLGLSFFRYRHKAVKINRKKLQKLIKEQVREIQVTQQTTIEALATLAEYRNKETGAHLERLRDYTTMLVKELAENSIYSQAIQRKDNYIHNISLASILHDVGKVVIPDAILLKSEKLTPDEFEKMKEHTLVAGGILEKANLALFKQFKKDSYLALAQQIAYYHHERWDGKGYPFELSGTQIPLCARIVSLCDVYDALTGERGYKESWSHEMAKENIIKGSGKLFDPVIVEAFLRIEDTFKGIWRFYQSKDDVKSMS